MFVDDRMRDPKAGKRGCPDDFRLVAAREYPQADRNGNGWVCRKMSGDKQFTDDKS
ncbi:MAG: hypothetical protein ACT4P5_12630 [Armatimonadota bacterium]